MFFHLFNTPTDFAPCSDASDSEEALLAVSRSSRHTCKCSAKRCKRDVSIVVVTCLFTSCIWLIAAVIATWDLEKRSASEKACMGLVSQYSPLVNEVRPGWHTVQFNGTFLRENVYRQDAGPEVDAAWEGLGVDYRPIVVPLEEGEKSGLDAGQVKVQNVFGGGFIANVEALHHLHCLNVLRKTLKWNYDYYLAEQKPPFSNSEEIVRFHATHCLDILRQQLMCVPDVGVMGQVWWKPENVSQPMPFVDFNTKHRCRDFDAVRMWAERHQLPREEYVDMDNFYKMPEPGDRIYRELP